MVGHFGLAVTDPRASADRYVDALGLREEFAYDDAVAVGSDGVTIALFAGKPRPETIDHVSFHLPDVATLHDALSFLKACGVRVQDQGDEIGPEAPGSPNLGIWLHDPDGYASNSRCKAERKSGNAARERRTRSTCG